MTDIVSTNLFNLTLITVLRQIPFLTREAKVSNPGIHTLHSTVHTLFLKDNMLF